MARPIKETPILKGKHAIAFLRAKKEKEGKKADPQVKQRILENFAKMQAIAKF